MAVNKQQALAGLPVFQHQAFGDFQAGEQRLIAAVAVAIVARALAGVGFSPLDNVVVAVNHVQPAGLIEFGQQLKGVGVGLNDGLLISIFPQLVSISQFDIGEALVVIMLQRAEKQILIGQKIIAVVSLSPMAIAHDNKL